MEHVFVKPKDCRYSHYRKKPVWEFASNLSQDDLFGLLSSLTLELCIRLEEDRDKSRELLDEIAALEAKLKAMQDEAKLPVEKDVSNCTFSKLDVTTRSAGALHERLKTRLNDEHARWPNYKGAFLIAYENLLEVVNTEGRDGLTISRGASTNRISVSAESSLVVLTSNEGNYIKVNPLLAIWLADRLLEVGIELLSNHSLGISSAPLHP